MNLSVTGKHLLEGGTIPPRKRARIDRQEENGPSDYLPSEVLVRILSFLSPLDLESAVRVSQRWRICSLDAAKWQKEAPLIDFIQMETLRQNLTETQIQKLQDLMKPSKISKATTLLEVEAFTRKTENDFLQILKELKGEYLEKMSDLESDLQPNFKRKQPVDYSTLLFDLARLYKAADEIVASSEIENEFGEKILWNLILIEGDEEGYARTVDLCDAFTNADWKGEVLKLLADWIERRSKGDIDEEEGEYIRDIPDSLFHRIKEQTDLLSDKFKNPIFRDLCWIFERKNNPDEALKIVNQIPSSEQKCEILPVLACLLADNERFDEALEIADALSLGKELSDEELLGFFFDCPSAEIHFHPAKSFRVARKPERSSKTEKISDPKYYNHSTRGIEIVCSDIKNRRKFLWAAESKEHVIIKSCSGLAEQGNVDRVIEIVKTRLETKFRIGRALAYIFIKLIQQKRFVDTKKVIFAMDDDEPRKLKALECLQEIMIEEAQAMSERLEYLYEIEQKLLSSLEPPH